MLLRDRPWYYRKGDEICQANYTSEARDYEGLGYKRIDKSGNYKESPAPSKAEAPEPETVLEETIDLESFTKAELVKYADKNHIQIKPNASKADILKACLEADG